MKNLSVLRLNSGGTEGGMMLFSDLPRALPPTPAHRIADGVFDGLPLRHFRTFYADPAWLFGLRSEKGEEKSPQAHYDCMTVEQMMALPVADLAHDDAAMFLWGTWPMMAICAPHELAKAWGFQPVTGGSWTKLSSTGEKLAFGTGYIVRSADEPFLICKRGEPLLKPACKSIRNAITDPDFPFRSEWAVSGAVREHSRKPDHVIDMVEAMFDGPYIELFARTTRPGWRSWGNEVGKFAEAVPA